MTSQISGPCWGSDMNLTSIHPFLLALRRWGRFVSFPPRETSPAGKSDEKRMFSQASIGVLYGKVTFVNKFPLSLKMFIVKRSKIQLALVSIIYCIRPTFVWYLTVSRRDKTRPRIRNTFQNPTSQKYSLYSSSFIARIQGGFSLG